MSKIIWDLLAERFYQTGCDHGVLYVMKDGAYEKGVPWNGLVNITESPGGDEPTKVYADNIVYFTQRSAPEYGGTIECYFTPKEFEPCDGISEMIPGVRVRQQRRSNFGFAYRTKKGNAVDGDDHGFVIHVVYNASVSPTEITHQTLNESPEAPTLSYEYTTVPVDIKGKGPDGKPWKPTAALEFDSTIMTEAQMKKVEEVLFGKDGEGEADVEPRLPSPDEWVAIFAALPTT